MVLRLAIAVFFLVVAADQARRLYFVDPRPVQPRSWSPRWLLPVLGVTIAVMAFLSAFMGD